MLPVMSSSPYLPSAPPSQMIESQDPVDGNQLGVMPVAPPRKRRSQDFGSSCDKRPMSLMIVKGDITDSLDGSGQPFTVDAEPPPRRPPYLPSISAGFQAEMKNALKKFPIVEKEEAEEEEKALEHDRKGKAGNMRKCAKEKGGFFLSGWQHVSSMVSSGYDSTLSVTAC